MIAESLKFISDTLIFTMRHQFLRFQLVQVRRLFLVFPDFRLVQSHQGTLNNYDSIDIKNLIENVFRTLIFGESRNALQNT